MCHPQHALQCSFIPRSSKLLRNSVWSVSLRWSMGLALPWGAWGSMYHCSHTRFSVPSLPVLPSALEARSCSRCLPFPGEAAVPFAQPLIPLITCLEWDCCFVLVLLLTSLCLSTPFGIKKNKGMNPVLESNLRPLHAAWCYAFLGIWPLLLLFPLSSCTGKVEVMLESLLGSRAFFPSKKPPNRQVGSFRSPDGVASELPRSLGLVPNLAALCLAQGRQPGRVGFVIK